MGMAAVLAMGSNGSRPSPVERGAWVLRKLLDRPPPPAPANVPQLSRLEGTPRSSRQLLAAHQEQPQCAHCHRVIDPIGFGLDNFDAAGRWRTEEVVTVAGQTPRRFLIDASGAMPDGRPFTGFEQLRALVASHENIFARSVAAQILEYAIGRPLGFTDEPTLDAIMAETRAAGFRLGDILHAVVKSNLLQDSSL